MLSEKKRKALATQEDQREELCCLQVSLMTGRGLQPRALHRESLPEEDVPEG